MMAELLFVLAASVIILGLLILVQRATTRLDRKYYQRKWSEIEATAGGAKSGRLHSITEADKLLDHALKQLMYRGETMADRLRAAEIRFRRKDALWSAHKLRNRIVHESDVKLSERQIRTALNSLRDGLKDLGAL